MVSGVIQWLFLRREFDLRGWWLAATVLGWLVAGGAGVATALAIGDLVDAAMGGGVAAFVVVLTMIGALAGMTGGMITGLALTRARGAISLPARGAA
jgi:hypothetical protein